MLHHSSKILEQVDLSQILQVYRSQDRCVVFTNGCFDILHRGHLELLAWARRQGDVLIVAINADESVRRLKGPSRPVNTQRDRANLLAGFICVDYVTIFEEDTPANIVELIQPDVLVKGGDYKDVTKIVGYDTVVQRGGQVLTVPYLDGYSTTDILRKITSL